MKGKRRSRANNAAGRVISPEPISGRSSVAELVERHFNAYNAARLREICELFAAKLSKPDVVIGMSLAGALTPAGLGASCIIPLIERGLVDWITTTGANCYHDLHFALGLPLRRGTMLVDDAELYDKGIVRIYDIMMDFRTLVKTDSFVTRLLAGEKFREPLPTSRINRELGLAAAAEEKRRGVENRSFLAAAAKCDVPVYIPSPGDSTIGMNFAALNVAGKSGNFDVIRDVNETSAIVLHAKTEVGKSAAIIWGGGAPKNFMLQTEPQLQEILGFDIKGHDYFVQVTDARPDTGGLSGATPSEAVSWGKVDADMIPDTVVCYADTTIVMPLVVAYVVEKNLRRKPRRLYRMLDSLVETQARKFRKGGRARKGSRSVSETVRFLRSQIRDAEGKPRERKR